MKTVKIQIFIPKSLLHINKHFLSSVILAPEGAATLAQATIASAVATSVAIVVDVIVVAVASTTAFQEESKHDLQDSTQTLQQIVQPTQQTTLWQGGGKW